jgi:hypothetical protein
MLPQASPGAGFDDFDFPGGSAQAAAAEAWLDFDSIQQIQSNKLRH